MSDMTNPHNIRSDIPFPGRSSRKATDYPWRTINVGESFFVERIGTARVGVSRQRHEQPLKVFEMRASREEVGGRMVEGARVWRLDDRTPAEARKWFEDRGALIPWQLDEPQGG